MVQYNSPQVKANDCLPEWYYNLLRRRDFYSLEDERRRERRAMALVEEESQYGRLDSNQILLEQVWGLQEKNEELQKRNRGLLEHIRDLQNIVSSYKKSKFPARTSQEEKAIY